MTLDDQFSEVAQHAPWFGGLFIDDDMVVIYTTNISRSAQVVDAAQAVLGDRMVPPASQGSGNRVRLQIAQFGFAALQQWHDQALALFEHFEIVMIDVDERANRLRITLPTGSDSQTRARVEEWLGHSGIPAAAVIVDYSPEVVQTSTVRDNVDPLEGGIQV